MGTFAGTPIVDSVYRLPTKEKNFLFPFPFAGNKREVGPFRFLSFP
jgi:hypothetical protein